MLKLRVKRLTTIFLKRSHNNNNKKKKKKKKKGAQCMNRMIDLSD